MMNMNTGLLVVKGIYLLKYYIEVVSLSRHVTLGSHTTLLLLMDGWVNKTKGCGQWKIIAHSIISISH